MIDLSGLRILVIDDSTTIRRGAEIFLKGPADKPTGIIIKVAEEGFDAISDIYDFKPHMILLDVVMEKVDGFTMCSAIKSNPSFKDIKVVMLTSKVGIYDRARGLEAKADGYMTKPFKPKEFLEQIVQYAPTDFRSTQE